VPYKDQMEASQAALRKQVHAYHEDFRRWPEDKKRRHRLRRAAHELGKWDEYPAYRFGEKDGRLVIGPKEFITPELRTLVANYRDDLLLWCAEHGSDAYREEDEGNV